MVHDQRLDRITPWQQLCQRLSLLYLLLKIL